MALEILKANIPLFEGFVEHRIALDDAEEVSATRGLKSMSTPC
jgi:hypothetical protein